MTEKLRLTYTEFSRGELAGAVAASGEAAEARAAAAGAGEILFLPRLQRGGYYFLLVGFGWEDCQEMQED